MIRHLILSGRWLDAAPRMDLEKTSLKESGLHAQKSETIIGSIVTIIGTNLYDHLMSTRILILIMNKIFI